MFDAPTEDWHAYLGLSLVAVALVAVAGALPTAPPPDAGAVAATVDRIAVAGGPAAATHPLPPGSVRLTARFVAVRTEGGSAHARFAFGPVVPVDEGSRLDRVLEGTPAGAVFEDPEALERAVDRAGVNRGDSERGWRPTDGPLRVRRVVWGGVDVTLVGA